jgi:hypothetical protein
VGVRCGPREPSSPAARGRREFLFRAGPPIHGSFPQTQNGGRERRLTGHVSRQRHHEAADRDSGLLPGVRRSVQETAGGHRGDSQSGLPGLRVPRLGPRCGLAAEDSPGREATPRDLGRRKRRVAGAHGEVCVTGGGRRRLLRERSGPRPIRRRPGFPTCLEEPDQKQDDEDQDDDAAAYVHLVSFPGDRVRSRFTLEKRATKRRNGVPNRFLT